ncbi:MAG TPA: TonB family protein [Candidatus Polarisedimenticolia bacterium]|nr:TonB family protein [Candidatus Polarisedimenticolia bacterium]
MFDQLVVSSVQGSKTNKPWTVALSAIIQFVIIGILILIPLIYTEALPTGMLSTFLVAPAPPPPPPPPAAPVKVVRPRIIQPQRMVAPTVIPKKIEIIKEAAPDVSIGQGNIGVVGGTGPLGGVGPVIAPPPPKPVTPARIRVGGNVQAASLVRKVQPVYPQIARTAHVSGTVVLHAIIAKDGTIQELQYVTGPPLLMRAAMDAVREWRYKPTLLNGEPVEVDTTISVVFSLGG